MKKFIVEARRAAQIAASRVIISDVEYLERDCIKYYDDEKRIIHWIEPNARKMIVENLVEAGFPGFISTSEQDIVPLSFGWKVMVTGETWTSWERFDLEEMKAYNKHYELDMFDENGELDPERGLAVTRLFGYDKGVGRAFMSEPFMSKPFDNQVFIIARGGLDI